ncbi:MAG TPA: NUDIX hydrolase [Pseudolabrys sp.]|nr:NUDIX hydrolase [Pseudolabrys sp.]
MAAVERDLGHPFVEPHDAATLILIDRSDREPKVLLGRRHPDSKFMPGMLVFPGGRTEPLDRTMPAISELHPDVEKKLITRVKETPGGYARGFPLAALRETAEETGLLIGVKRDEPPATPGGLWEEFAKARVFPDLGELYFVARAITPPGRTRRFDSRFFTTDASAVAHRIEGVVGPDSELVELVWMPVSQAKTLKDMPIVTGVVLDELANRVRAGMGHDLPVPMYYMEGGKFFRELL